MKHSIDALPEEAVVRLGATQCGLDEPAVAVALGIVTHALPKWLKVLA